MDEISFGDRLQDILNDPIFEQVIHLVQDETFDEWSNSESLEEREELFAEIRGAERFLKRVRAAIDNAHLIRQRQKD